MSRRRTWNLNNDPLAEGIALALTRYEAFASWVGMLSHNAELRYATYRFDLEHGRG